MIAAAGPPAYNSETMAKRRLRFYCGFAARHYALDLPGILLSLPVQRMVPSEVRHEIRIVDPTPQTRALFSKIVGQALDLIAACDRVRFGRVRMQIRKIVNLTGLIGSVYQPAFRVCTLNLRCFGYHRDGPGTIRF